LVSSDWLTQFPQLFSGLPQGESTLTGAIPCLWRDCVDQGCVEVCPVDRIYEYSGDDKETYE
jgi:hypothetical protein